MIALGVSVPACLADTGATAPTVIQVGDQVEVKDCSTFGSQCKGKARFLKKPVSLNFEGILHRRIIVGEMFSDGVMVYGGYRDRFPTDVAKWYLGADITVLSGVGKGEKRKIKEIKSRKGFGFAWGKGRDERVLDFLVFDKPIKGIDESLRKGQRRIAGTPGQNPYHGMGLLLEKNDLMLGSLGRSVGRGGGVSESIEFVHDDLPPGTTGKSALLLKANTTGKALRVNVHFMADTDLNRVYKLAFWGKAVAEGAKLHVAFESREPLGAIVKGLNLPSGSITLSNEWKRYEVSYDLRGKFPSLKPGGKLVNVKVWLGGGNIILDDVEIWGEGYSNPTPFVDEVVKGLKDFGGSNFRRQVMAGPGLADYFKSAIDQPDFISKYDSDPRSSGGLIWQPGIYDVYSLCEYLQIEPWFNTPGTIYVEEIDFMMEYIGGPVSTPGGKLRAEQGHPQPWIETLPRIHIEYTNEAWLFGGGYNGPDHWKDLTTRAKKSPYYDPKKIVFHIGGKSTSAAWNIPAMKNCPNADRITIAPYLGLRFPAQIREICPTPADRARWTLGLGIDQNITGKYMKQQSDYALSNGMELSIYEINHHIITIGKRGPRMGSTTNVEDLKIINEYLISQIAGVAAANNMLAMLREHHIRTQSFFEYAGSFYGVRLWGGVLRSSMKPEECRSRPTWLALTAANRGMFGDLLTTSHTGAKPVFEAAGFDERGRKIERPLYDCLWSYSFKDGKKRSIIVANLDVTKSLPIVIRVPGKPNSQAKMWRSEGKDFLASNEMENAKPGAFLKKSAIVDFKDGYTMTLPPATITTIVWNEK